MARRRVMSQGGVVELAKEFFPSFLAQYDTVERLDTWARNERPKGEGVFMPDQAGAEYRQMVDIANDPWLELIVRSLTQTMFLDGVRRKGQVEGNLKAYDVWQRNGWDAWQTPLYRASCFHGQAFGVAENATDPLTRENSVSLTAVSARRMAAFYDDDGNAEWAEFAIRAKPYDSLEGSGWNVRVYDDTAVHWLTCSGTGTDTIDWKYLTYTEHNAGVTPVVRYPSTLDLDGRSPGIIAPLIPLARRIDQDTFDRLIVQRFGAWKVRYIAGMAKPDSKEAQQKTALALKVEDLLVSDNPNTKFGTLDASDLKQFIEAHSSDLRDLSAVSQTPPHHLLGVSSNLQAESLAAAEAGLQRNGLTLRTLTGEKHEQLFRLTGKMIGEVEEARAFDMQVRWRDTESRSLEQAAMALATLARDVGVPLEMLWERIPGWTDYDTDRAKKLVESGAIDQLVAALQAQTAAPAGAEPQQEPAGAGAS